MKEISNNFENSNDAIIYMMKEILNLKTSKVSNESYEILTTKISNLNDDVKSLKKEFLIDFSNINSSMKEIFDLRTCQKLENNEMIDINTFNNWNISDFDDDYNINEGINIAHKKYFSENNLVEINKIVKDNIEIPQSIYALNMSFYTNILEKNPKKDIFNPYSDEIMFKTIITTTKYLLSLVNLIDKSDKFIKYNFPPITNNDKLKMLFDMIITGFNTQLNERGSLSGILDMNNLKLQFIALLNNHKNIIKTDEYNKLKTVIDNIFNSSQNLLSWQQLMVKYFTMINMINSTLKDIYKSENDNLIRTNTFIYDYHNLSRQINGFIEMFYNIGIFLTMFINIINKSDEHVEHYELKSNNLKWWNEHIILIFDYHKSLVLNDIVISEKIKNKLSILEIAPNLIKMFDIYNNLINNKDLYKILNSVTH
jgi:hypothetical protein